MRRIILTLGLTLATLTSAQAAHDPDCDLRVTRVRNTDHMDCYLRLGPKTPTFSHTNTAQLEELSQCIERVDKQYKLARFVCEKGQEAVPDYVMRHYQKHGLIPQRN